jgi:multiple sugar transport system ATP-binding protein
MKSGVIQQLADPQTIYERPANMFVAGFIGSPTMNFLSGTLDQADGTLVLRHGEATLALPEAGPEAKAFIGKTVVAGIRPETFSPGQGKGVVSGVVDVVEPTGPDTMVILNVGGQMLTVRLGSRDRPKLGEPMTLAVDTASINLFDPETGNRI